jgi:hypothetical protein
VSSVQRVSFRSGPVEGDPLADINVAINNLRWVMKAGGVVVDKTKAQVR